MKLDSQVVLITGASSGVGFAAAEKFAQAGADVAVCARGEDGLERAAEAVRAVGREALVVPADVTDQERMTAVVGEVVERFGKLDVLVVNAAAPLFGPFEQQDKDDFDRVVEVTFIGAVNTVRAALPALKDAGGVVVATGSINAKLPLPTWSSYCAAKHAERGFLHSLRLEFEAERSPVRVAMVNPGQIDTPVWETAATATGTMPRKPPYGYSPEAVAAALVRQAVYPVPELTIGLEAKAIESLWRLARPFGDVMWRAVHHYNLSGRSPKPDRDALVEAVGKGVARDGILSRPSLTAPVRSVVSSAIGRLRR